MDRIQVPQGSEPLRKDSLLLTIKSPEFQELIWTNLEGSKVESPLRQSKDLKKVEPLNW